jgi:hypothetical protein
VSTAVSLDLARTQLHPRERDYPAPTSIGCNLLKSESAASPVGALVNQQQSQRLYAFLAPRGKEAREISGGCQAACVRVTLANLRLPTCRT